MKNPVAVLCLAALLAGCTSQKSEAPKDELLHCWDLKTHQEKWTKNVLAEAPSSLLAADPYVLASLSDGTAAYSAEGGSEVWMNKKLDLVSTGGRHESVVREHAIYASSGLSVSKIDLARGETLWTQEENAVLLEQQGTSPLFTIGQNVTARDLATGKPLWAHPLPRRDVLVVVGDLFFTTEGPYLEARQNNSGEALWKVELPPEFSSPRAVNADNSLLLNSGGALSRLDLKTRKFLWNTANPQPDGQLSAATVLGNSVLAISSGRGESAHALEIDWKTGKVSRDVDLGRKIDGNSRANRFLDTQTLFAVETEKHVMWLDPWSPKIIAEATGEFVSPSADATSVYYLEMRR